MLYWKNLPVEFWHTILYYIFINYTTIGIIMINENSSKCPKCDGTLKYYDSVKRIVRTKYNGRHTINIKRYKCVECKSVHRKIPNYISPYKQYEVEVIVGVIENLITCETLGYEDYPCEQTMVRWRTQNLQLLLWEEY